MDRPRGTTVGPFDVEGTREETHVLHVDDDEEMTSLVTDFLESRYEWLTVYTEARAEAGLELMETARIDGVVSDYDLDGMDGIEFLEAIRDEYPELPFVLFTGKGSETVASEAISKGVTEYMQKGGGTDQFHLLANRLENAVDQYRARQALYESEQRYRTVVENSFEGVYVYSGDEFLYANDRIAELTGYDPSELAEIDIWQLLHPEDRGRVQDIAERRADPDADAPSTYEARVLRKDGEVRHCEFAVQAITYEGEFAALGSVRDITQRRERQRQLERYETMVEVSGDPMYTLDEAGRFTYVNDRLCEISGYDRSEIIGSHVSIMMSEEDVQTGERVIEELLQDESMAEATFEMDVIAADGRRIESENHIALLPVEEGFQGTVGVVRDIGDRKRRERRLSRLHEAATELGRADTEADVYSELVAAGRDILDFDFVSVDSVEEDRLVMRENTSVTGTDEYYESVPLDSEESLAAQVALEGETSLVDDLREVNATPADPEYRSVLTVPIGDLAVFQAGSKDVGAFDDVDRETAEVLAEHARTALLTIRNRRQLRAQRRELERENERLEEFASVVSHDLRNPLTVASGRLSDAVDECESDALDDVEGALTRMDRLIGDLLDLARQGKRVENPEPVALPSLVDRCWTNVATQAAALDVTASGTIKADESRVAQLFENLFRNSVEHAGPGDALETGADSDGSVVTIRVGDLEDGFFVEDDGPGIPEDERDEVFETGYTNSEDGTGFGLSIVEQVAAAHGWDLALTEGEAGGARFEFTGVEFVAVDEESAEEAEEPEEDADDS